MTNPYQPHVTIGGRRLPEHADPADLTPTATFSIEWGASDWWSDVEPATLRMTFIDPTGQFLDPTAGEGLPIVITRDDPDSGPDSVTVFDGTIDETSTRMYTRTHPVWGVQQTLWETHVIARDPLAKLAGDRRHGPVYTGAGADTNAEGLHWGNCTMTERQAALGARSPVPLVFAESWVDYLTPKVLTHPYNTMTYMVRPINGYEKSANVSVLQVLRNTYRSAHILARPYYDPQRGAIVPIRHTPYTDANIGLRFGQSPDGPFYLSTGDMLPAGVFVAHEIEVESTALEQTTRLARATVRARWKVQDNNLSWDRAEIVEETNAVTRAPVQATVEVSADIDPEFVESINGPHPYEPWNENVAAFIRGIYGRATTPPLEWRQRFDPDPDRARVFLNPCPAYADDTAPLSAVYALGGSLASWHPQTGPFSIVGGEIHYGQQGWSAILNPAAVPSTTPPIKLGEIVTGGAWKLGELAGYRVADLQKINIP